MRMVFRTLVFATPLLLAGCGWFGSSTSVTAPSVRPGAERQTTATGLPAAPQRGNYEGAQPPSADGRGESIGSVVTAKGGQKAQQDQREKERAKVDAERAREREERERRAAAEPAATPAADPGTGPAPLGTEPPQSTEPAPR